MTPKESAAIRWFTRNYPDVPEHEDGTVDYEALCEEFIADGFQAVDVQKHYANLPAKAKKEAK
jgi:hypothetical protein